MQMVVQALQSGDKELFETAISVHDASVMSLTVRNLPVSSVVPFLDQVVRCIEASPNRALSLVSWTRLVLVSHAGYLSSLPQNEKLLRPLRMLIDERVQNRTQMMRVAGKLDVVLAGLERKTEARMREDRAVEQMLHQPMAIYDEEQDQQLQMMDYAQDVDEEGSDASEQDANVESEVESRSE